MSLGLRKHRYHEPQPFQDCFPMTLGTNQRRDKRDAESEKCNPGSQPRRNIPTCLSRAFSSVPLSLWLNRGHPQGAASDLYLHDLTTHPSPWGPRFPGEKLSSLAFRCEPSGLSTCGWAAGVTWQGELTVLTCNWDGPQEACAEISLPHFMV